MADPAAVRDQVAEVWPDVANADELHDALMVSGFLTEIEGRRGRDGVSWMRYWDELVRDRRAAKVGTLWVARERLPLIEALTRCFSVPPCAKRTAWKSSGAGVVSPNESSPLTSSTVRATLGG